MTGPFRRMEVSNPGFLNTLLRHDRARESTADDDDYSKLPSAKRRIRRVFRSYSTGPRTLPAFLWGCLAALLLIALSLLFGRLIVNTVLRSTGAVGVRLSATERLRLLPTEGIRAQKAAPRAAALADVDMMLYRPDDAMPGVGDHSARYSRVRKSIDDALPDDDARTSSRIRELSHYHFDAFPMDDPHTDAEVYDIYSCPAQPPRGYPYQWNLLKILDNWNPDDTMPRPTIYNGLCVFDYQRDYDKAMNYRDRDLPYVVVNDPSVQRTAERWAHPGYMRELLGDRRYGVEYTRNNHFMYGNPSHTRRRRGGKDPQPAERDENWYGTTTHMEMTYTDWLNHANAPEPELTAEKPRWYFRLIGCGKFRGDVCRNDGDVGAEYLLDELPFFQPKEGLYLVDPTKQAGIHCRFGMKGLIAENHWDAGRNSIVLLGGTRRYILASLDMCDRLALYPKGHPSGRHSAVDWSNPDLAKFPEFANARANEVVLQPGQLLYLPGKTADQVLLGYCGCCVVGLLSHARVYTSQRHGFITSSVSKPMCNATLAVAIHPTIPHPCTSVGGSRTNMVDSLPCSVERGETNRTATLPIF